MLLRLVRHGESEGNLAGSLQGSRYDTPLSETGRRQAECLAARRAGEEIGSVWASAMIRARETAAAVAAVLGLGVSLDPDLVEFDWGAWSGRPYDGEIEKEVSGVRARWRAGETDLSPSGGESPAHAAFRADRFLARLLSSGSRAPLVVAHGRFNRVLMTRLLGRVDEIRQRNGSLSVFEWDGSRPAAPLLLDDISHQPPEIRNVSVLSDSVR